MEFPLHWLVILVIVLVLFGGKKIPEVMRGMGEGIRSFKEGMRGDEPGHAQTTQTPPTTTTTVTTEKKVS